MQKLVDPLLRSKILKKISVAYFVIKGYIGMYFILMQLFALK